MTFTVYSIHEDHPGKPSEADKKAKKKAKKAAQKVIDDIKKRMACPLGHLLYDESNDHISPQRC